MSMHEQHPNDAVDAMLDPRTLDPQQDNVHFEDMSEEALERTIRVLSAIRRWRESDQQLSAKARRDMNVNETDMKTLRYLVVAKNEHRIVTAGDLSEYLQISTSSTTKLIDRLAAAGHVVRSPHPTDRRALAISITDATHERVHHEVGRSHARRFDIAAALTSTQATVIIDFLNALSDANEMANAHRPSDDDAHAETSFNHVHAKATRSSAPSTGLDLGFPNSPTSDQRLKTLS